MAGLVSYGSSDDESDSPSQTALQDQTTIPASSTETVKEKASTNESSKESTNPEPPQQPSGQTSQPPTGPALGPSLPPEALNPPESISNRQDLASGPLSPYSANRALVHDLTLPSIPNLDIPPSPPSSPSPATNKKFQQFLDLKKKGTHFNSKLEQSAALRNPSLMDKLLSFVDMDGSSQYETTLPLDLWDPSGFPEWASREELKKSRESVAKERETERASGNRTAIDFVGSSSNTPSGGSRIEKRKGGWK